MRTLILVFLFFHLILCPSFSQTAGPSLDGFFVVTGNGFFVVCYNKQQNSFSLRIPNTLKPLSNNTFEGENYIFQILVADRTELGAQQVRSKTAFAQKYVDWEKKYLEENYKNKFHNFKIFNADEKSGSILWFYILKPADDAKERYIYYYTRASGDITVSLSCQFFEETDLQTFKTIANQAMSSLVFETSPIHPQSVIDEVTGKQSIVKETAPIKETAPVIQNDNHIIFEGKFLGPHNDGYVVLLEDSSLLKNAFVKLNANWENVGNNQWIAMFTMKDVMTNRVDVYKFLFKKAVKNGSKVVILERVTENGFEMSKRQVQAVGRLLVGGAMQ